MKNQGIELDWDRFKLDPYGRFNGHPIPEWADKDCCRCWCKLYSKPETPVEYFGEWYCIDCAIIEEITD